MTADDTETERPPDTPSEWTFSHYREAVEVARDVTLEAMRDYPDENQELHDAVAQSIDGDKLHANRGWALMTVLLSDQDPERPDYCERWSVYVDFSGVSRRGESDPPTWRECVSEMARVCYYSDVMDAVHRSPPGKWERIDAGRFYLRADPDDRRRLEIVQRERQLPADPSEAFEVRGPDGVLGDAPAETWADALDRATEYMEANPRAEVEA